MKLIKTADLRQVLNSYNKEEISFSKMAEILNEKANERLNKVPKDSLCKCPKEFNVYNNREGLNVCTLCGETIIAR